MTEKQKSRNKKKKVIYRSMADYKIEECSYSIFYYMNKWSWVIVPDDIIETGKYEFEELNYSLIQVLPMNTYSYTNRDCETDDILEDIIKDLATRKIKYSEKLTAILYDTKYKVMWMN